jgi:protein TonB
MRKQIDVLDWVSTFEFTREGGELKLDLKNWYTE